MEQRERLIGVLRGDYCPVRQFEFTLEELADYLLAHGVVVLPCKVGDTVYQIGKDFCDKRDHDKCDNYCDGWDDLCPENNGEWEVQTRVFTVRLLDLVGKSIYLTKEEAEKELAKRKGGDE